MNYLVLDFETAWSSKDKFGLKYMSLAEYVNDPRFKIFGMASKWLPDGQSQWRGNRPFPLMNWSNTIIIAHNAKFEAAILRWKFGVHPKAWIDTMAMSMAVDGSTVSSHSLKAIAERLGLPAKGELETDGLADLNEESESKLSEYCMRDVEITAAIYEHFKPKFPESQYDILSWTIQTFVDRPFDLDASLATKTAVDVKAANAETIKKTGFPIEVFRSNPQFASLLKEKGYEVPTKKNKKGVSIPALSNGDVAFVRMRDGAAGTELRELLKARQAAKQTLEIKRAEKLSQLDHYSFDIAFSGAMQTHRFSGGNGFAGNPQQMHVKGNLRKTIRAPKGHIILDGDFVAVEPHILAFASGEKKMITAYKNKQSLYCQFGTEFFKFPVVKDDSDEYKASKASVLGFGYGMGADKFVVTAKTKANLELTKSRAAEFAKFYRDYFPAVPAFWRRCEIVLEIMSHKTAESPFPGLPSVQVGYQYLRLPSGLKIQYLNLRKELEKDRWGNVRPQWHFDRYDSKLKTLQKIRIWGGYVTENLVQALAGEVCKEAIRRLIEAEVPVAGQVHDELLVVCKEEDVQSVEKYMYQSMTEPMPWWDQLILEAEICKGQTWGECQ